MKIGFSCDHAGFPLREIIKNHLWTLGHEVIDFWPQEYDDHDDFPSYSEPLCIALKGGEIERGILVCGTGIGMSIAANRHKYIRAVLGYNSEIVAISRSHNNANILCIGARTQRTEDIPNLLEIFLETEFLWGKYQRRNDLLEEIC